MNQLSTINNSSNIKLPKIKVLIILTYPKRGGTELSLLNILKHYTNNHFIFDIVFLYKKSVLSEQFKKYSNKIIHLNNLHINFKLIKSFIQITKNNSYNIILSFGLKPILISRFLKIFFPSIKIVNNLRSLFSGVLSGHRKISICLDYLTSFLMDEYWANSKAGMKNLLKNKFNSKKIKLFHNGIDLKHIDGTTPYITDNLKEKCKDKLIIANTSNLSWVKNHEFIIETVKHIVDNGVNNFIVLIMGEGKLKDTLQKKIDNYNLNDYIILTGQKQNVISILKSSDIFLFTSFIEGLPNAVLEAASAGLPVVSSNAGGTKEIVVNNKGGYIINDFDKKLFAEKIIKLIQSEDLRKNLGEYNKKYVQENFAFDKMIAAFNELLTNVSKQKLVSIVTRLNIGGPAKIAFYISKLFNNKFFNSILLSGYVEKNEDDMIFLAEQYNIKPVYIKNLHRAIKFKDDFLALINNLKILFKEKPDIVHTHTAKAGTIGRAAAVLYNIFNFFTFRKRAKVFHTFHGHTFHSYHSKSMTRLFIFIEKILTKFCTNKVIVLSQQQFNEIVYEFKIGNPNKFAIVPLGLNFDEIKISDNSRLEFRNKFNIENDSLVVAIIGRLTKVKNHLRFLGIVKRFIHKYPDLTKNNKIRFCIIGEGELLNDLNNFVDRQNLNKHVIFTGNIRSQNMLYSGFDILALTSDNEGTPLTILESFYCKIPVISTAVGGAIDLLKNERGFAINKNDRHDYVDKLKELITNDEIKNQFIENAYNYVMANHSLENLKNNLLKLYLD